MLHSISAKTGPQSRRDILRRSAGFSLIEMLFALTITLIVISLAFGLLAQSLNKKSRDDASTDALSDANQAISWMSQDIINAGFGLKTNGLMATDCSEEKIRVRANLNSLLKETTSGTVTDPDEDVIYQLVANENSGNALVRSDVAAGTSVVIASNLDDTDADGDGDGDGLNFTYLDEAGNIVTPAAATRVEIGIQITLPQQGVPGQPGFQPQQTKHLSSRVVLRNTRLMSY